MHDLIYINTDFLRKLDPFLESKEYAHGHWFRLHRSIYWTVHTQSRVHKLDTPWHLAPTICPIPTIDEYETRFDVVIESVAEDFGRRFQQNNKTIFLAWSGGVDSTSILVSILKTWSQDLLDRLIILCDERSIAENPYFYHTFIENKFQTRPVSWLEINEHNYDKIIILDGEAGNQIISGSSVQRLSYRGRFDLLNEPWQNRKDLREILIGADAFNIEIIQESIKHAPVDIRTGYDFLWWTGFNMKMQDALLRKMFLYAKNLTPDQTKSLWENGAYRFYGHPKMQIWSMNTRDLRREKLPVTVKYHPKKYIYDFDHNDFYWSNKAEQPSTNDVYLKYQPGPNSDHYIFAMDKHWNQYSFADPEIRSQLGKILQRA